MFVFLLMSFSMFARGHVEKYKTTWLSQSENSSESMPVGGGDVGLNVWVENNELLFYIGQSGTFDENNQMLKHGRVRVKFSPNPFKNAEVFQQELKLHEGGIEVVAKNTLNEIKINIWVDVYKPIIHLETVCKQPTEVKAAYETWRMEDRVVPQGMRHSSFSLSGYPGEVVTFKDSIRFTENGIRWFHRNRSDKLLYDFMIKQQELEPVKDQIPNTQLNRTFGGELLGAGMRPVGLSKGKYVNTDFTAWQLQSEVPQKSHHLRVVLNTGQFDEIQQWESVLNNYVEISSQIEKAKQDTKKWWKQFWDRSYICINDNVANVNDEAWQVGRNYQLFRYMLGCNAYGDYPSKFNGSLFTFDPVFMRKGQFDWTPDFRQWGGGSFTAQNQRLVYWPMLKSGDFDMMPSQFEFYKRALSSAEVRTKVYWGHGGACYTEQLENFGLPFAGGWGFESGGRKRNPDTEFGVQTNRYVKHHYVNQVEFSLMILDYYQFSGKDISGYLPFIKSSVRFFDEHYQYRHKARTGEALDENGKLVFYPSTAAEMYKIAKNPVDVISALKVVLPRMLELPDNYVNLEEKEYYKSFLSRVPDIPFDEKEGLKVIKPAESWEYVANQEIPELYPVFPYGIYGLNKPGLDFAINTWNVGESHEKKKWTLSWSQVGIFAARLGLIEETSQFIVNKMKDSGRRFPAFWGPGADWVPDFNHGGSGMINLQEMLMQTNGQEIHLFPAWPKGWDVKFKLHAPFNTTVEAELKDGELINLNVFPKERRGDIQLSINIKDINKLINL